MSQLASPLAAAVVVLAQTGVPQQPSPATDSGWGWLIILVALAIFLVAVMGGIATLRHRRPHGR